MTKRLEASRKNAVVKIIGVGGGGNNITQHLESNGIDCLYINTDKQSLKNRTVGSAIQIGVNTTKGLSADGDPKIGRQAALESSQCIREVIENTGLLFIIASMGGGTGTGAAPVIANIAKELDVLTYAIVTKPFDFEKSIRKKQAELGIKALENIVGSIHCISNDESILELDDKSSLDDVFYKINGEILGLVRDSIEQTNIY